MISEKLGNPIRLKDRETHKFIEYDMETCFAKSVKIFAEAEIEMERARTLREWSKSSFRGGNREQAEKMWQEARGIFERLGADMEVQRMAVPPSED
jgi:hypothetical protein